jgi:glycerol uptake facilitator-like aquaporin
MAKAKATAMPAMKMSPLGGELAIGALIAELVGTFALTFAVLNTTGNAIVAAITLLVLVLMLAKLSGGHVNPGITVGLLVTKQISWVKAAGYIIAQLLGAMLAVVVASKFIAGTIDQNTGAAAKVFQVVVSGDWKPFFAELVGSVIFGLGAASVFLGKKEGYEAAFTIGGSLLVGLILATAGSSAILNPAVALGVGALDLRNMWGLWSYALAPVIGVSVGMGKCI